MRAFWSRLVMLSSGSDPNKNSLTTYPYNKVGAVALEETGPGPILQDGPFLRFLTDS